MKLDNILLPHPILVRERGEIEGRFETNIGLEIDKEEVTLSVEHRLHNEVIQNLILKEKAAFFIDVSCSSTLFRKGFEFYNEGPGIIKIKASDLRDTVEVTCVIIAKENLLNYKNTYSNDFFEGKTFNISSSEILAYSGKDSFEVDKNWETPNSKGAFFMFYKHSGKDVKYELGSDPILIKLPEADYEIMRNIKKDKDLKSIFLSLYVYPAMLHVVNEFLSDRGETYNNNKWHKKLTDILKEEQYVKIGLSAENSPELVQKIFKYPLTNSINDLNTLSINFTKN